MVFACDKFGSFKGEFETVYEGKSKWSGFKVAKNAPSRVKFQWKQFGPTRAYLGPVIYI